MDIYPNYIQKYPLRKSLLFWQKQPSQFVEGDMGGVELEPLPVPGNVVALLFRFPGTGDGNVNGANRLRTGPVPKGR